MNSDTNQPNAEASAEAMKVVVRVRPFNEREKVGAVLMSAAKKTVTMTPKDGVATTFPFDSVLWSMDGPDLDGRPPATQVDVYNEIGKPLIAHAFAGFNSCLLAYGQTGSGKTYTMMGGGIFSADNPEAGVIPRLCWGLFEKRAQLESGVGVKWTVELGYVAVHNEKVTDLLADEKNGEDRQVDVREHPQKGVILFGQEMKTVNSALDIAALIAMGNRVRRVAATKMDTCGHTILQIVLKEQRSMIGIGSQMITIAGKSSRMNLVDLAGSTRVSQSHLVGQQLAEVKRTNKSLTVLGHVIDMLADMAKQGPGKRNAWSTPPHRGSKLTHILKNSLGGNSKTVMLATISPSAVNFAESMGTLRCAGRAKRIVSTPKVNEDPRARIIRDLEQQSQKQKLATMILKVLVGPISLHLHNFTERMTNAMTESTSSAGPSSPDFNLEDAEHTLNKTTPHVFG